MNIPENTPKPLQNPLFHATMITPSDISPSQAKPKCPRCGKTNNVFVRSQPVGLRLVEVCRCVTCGLRWMPQNNEIPVVHVEVEC